MGRGGMWQGKGRILDRGIRDNGFDILEHVKIAQLNKANGALKGLLIVIFSFLRLTPTENSLKMRM